MFNNNMWNVIIIAFFFLTISLVAQSLGISTELISEPDVPEAPESEGFLDALFAVVRWTFNVIGTFFQLLTFQVDIPVILNFIIITPLVFGILYLIVVVIRGGAY